MTETCARCGGPIGKTKYRLLFSVQEVVEEIAFRREETRRDLVAEMERLVEELSQIDPRELEAQVGIGFDAEICEVCREIIIERFRAAGGGE